MLKYFLIKLTEKFNYLNILKNKSMGNKISNTSKAVIAGCIGIVSIIIAAPFAICAAGFGAAGVVAGSFAASV
jgi:hypothetical protein